MGASKVVLRRFGPSGWALDPVMFVALEKYARRYGMRKSQVTRLAVRRLLEGAGLMKPDADDVVN